MLVCVFECVCWCVSLCVCVCECECEMKMRPEVLIRISFELKSYQRMGRKFMNTLPPEKILQGPVR